MKKPVFITIILIFHLFIFNLSVFASDDEDPINHSGHIGEKIHESNLKEYRLAYHLLDLPGRDTHHLMTYIIDQQGKAVKNATLLGSMTGPRYMKSF